jgi:hypothetical protein
MQWRTGHKKTGGTPSSLDSLNRFIEELFVDMLVEVAKDVRATLQYFPPLSVREETDSTLRVWAGSSFPRIRTLRTRDLDFMTPLVIAVQPFPALRKHGAQRVPLLTGQKLLLENSRAVLGKVDADDERRVRARGKVAPLVLLCSHEVVLSIPRLSLRRPVPGPEVPDESIR